MSKERISGLLRNQKAFVNQVNEMKAKIARVRKWACISGRWCLIYKDDDSEARDERRGGRAGLAVGSDAAGAAAIRQDYACA